MQREHNGKFTNLRKRISRVLQQALWVLVALIYVPICTAWITHEAYLYAQSVLPTASTAIQTVTPTAQAEVKGGKYEQYYAEAYAALAEETKQKIIAAEEERKLKAALQAQQAITDEVKAQETTFLKKAATSFQ